LIEFCKCFNSSLDYLVSGKVDNTQIENKKKEVQEIIERLENLFVVAILTNIKIRDIIKQ